jgi:hypothetical protein
MPKRRLAVVGFGGTGQKTNRGLSKNPKGQGSGSVEERYIIATGGTRV